MELDYFDEPNEIYLLKTQENNWKNHETTQKESSTINLRLGGGKIVFHTSTYGGEAIFFFLPASRGGSKNFHLQQGPNFFQAFHGICHHKNITPETRRGDLEIKHPKSVAKFTVHTESG